jgi:hypothetical protein
MWAEAYLEQARSDWQMWQLIRKQKMPDCHALHYLQMTCEKLGKAFLLEGKSISLQQAVTSHTAFKRFLQIASRHPLLRELFRMNSAQFRAFIRQLLPLADDIEHLTPALAQRGPNVEYPWESPDKQVYAPVHYTFTVMLELHKPHGTNLLKLVNLVQQHFYRLFTKSHKSSAQN